MVVGVGLWVVHPPDPQGRHGDGRSRRRDAARGSRLCTLALGFGASRASSCAGSRSTRACASVSRLRPPLGANRSGERATSARPTEYQPQFATGPVLVVVALVAIAVVAWYLSYRARRSKLEPLPESLLPALADVLDETLDDLRAETDPRRAVIAAYARMERALAAYGLPRSPAEAPDEYLQRIFADLDVSGRATSRLTALFTWAKFSGHDVAPEMKQEAIEALEAVREELRRPRSSPRSSASPPSPSNASGRAPDAAAPGASVRLLLLPTIALGVALALAPSAGHARGARVAPRRPRPRAPRLPRRRPDGLSAHALRRSPRACGRAQVAAERPGAARPARA